MYKDMYKIHGDLNTWIQKETLVWGGHAKRQKDKYIYIYTVKKMFWSFKPQHNR